MDAQCLCQSFMVSFWLWKATKTWQFPTDFLAKNCPVLIAARFSHNARFSPDRGSEKTVHHPLPGQWSKVPVKRHCGSTTKEYSAVGVSQFALKKWFCAGAFTKLRWPFKFLVQVSSPQCFWNDLKRYFHNSTSCGSVSSLSDSQLLESCPHEERRLNPVANQSGVPQQNWCENLCFNNSNFGEVNVFNGDFTFSVFSNSSWTLRSLCHLRRANHAVSKVVEMGLFVLQYDPFFLAVFVVTSGRPGCAT